MKDKFKNFIYIFLPLILGGIVGLIIKGNIDYDTLNQPLLAPPALLFPIVWSSLYLLMGIAYYLIKKQNEQSILYYIQLIVNLLWPIIFFTFKQRLIALIWIIVLDFLIFTLLKEFYVKKKASAYLLIPYFLWTIFATYLNFGIYILN